MESNEDFDYETVEEVLAEAEIECNAAELQGILSGMISAGLKLSDKDWKVTLIDLINEERPVDVTAHNMINQIAEWTFHAMGQQDSLAPMLLPDDSYPAVDQLEAIAEWCQGFLLGFGLQFGDTEIENDDIKEALTDLSDISQLEIEADEDDETQNALFTVIEHVKVAVQVIYWEIVVKQQSRLTTSEADNQTIH